MRGDKMQRSKFDAAATVPFSHPAPPAAHLMLPGHHIEARQLYESKGHLGDTMKLRYDAQADIMTNPGQITQIPLPPNNTGYVTAMKRQTTSSAEILPKVTKIAPRRK